jgi:hypothetical protein
VFNEGRILLVLTMTSETSILAKVDAYLAEILSHWDIYSTAIATLIIISISYAIFFTKDPDVHPYVLARQAIESPTRHRGESATYRALDVPHGYPLRSGLNVKDPGAPKWTSGRSGDLRDIWRAAVRGALNDDGTPSGRQGKIFTVLGKNVMEHNLNDISQEVNIIGQYIRDLKVQTVVVCLSDSVELLSTIFGS